MIQVTVIYENKKDTFCFEQSVLLSEVIQLHHFPLEVPCGGKGKCKQCRVKAVGELSPITQTEKEGLTAEELQRGIRLACLTYAQGNVEVTLFPKGRLENIVVKGVMPNFNPKPMMSGYGVSVDIGTTTIAAQLYGLSNGTALQAVCMKNPQVKFGADVMTRIEQALNQKSEQLYYSIANGIDRMVREMAKQEQIKSDQIDAIVLTGNTVMLYLLTRQNVDCLAHAPFVADRLFGESVQADEIGIASAPFAKVYLPRCISAFVGADITMAILASGMYKKDQTSLLVDIGTNGEIALWHNGKMYCCSTAAGPAFEGAGIHMGVNGVNGAIDSVRIEQGKIICTTIGDKPAIGICGSGIIDAISVLCEAQVIDETGFMLEEGHEFEHLVTDCGGEAAFCINEHDIIITQKDIRMVQLAKSAICAGMLTVIQNAGLVVEDIDCLYIAGGFGSYINLDNAARIGLIPPQLAPKALVIGNAAASGANMLLQNTDYIAESYKIAKNAQIIELTTNPLFLDHYMDCMSF